MKKQFDYVALSEKKCRVGETHHNALLTDKQVLELKQMRADGNVYTKIALHFGVSKSTVAMICRGGRRSIKPVLIKKLEPK